MSQRTRVVSVLLALAATLIFPACTDLSGPEPDAAPELIASLPRALTATEEQAIAASNAFGFDLLRLVQADPKSSANVVLSPLSASLALGMTLNGAAGETFDAMRSTLRFGSVPQESINASFHDLVDMLLALDPKVQLGIANSTWAREGFPFLPEFFETIGTWFDAEARELDFTDPATVDAINQWACQSTEERICQVLDGLDPSAILVLMNAVYFKGQWSDRFDRGETHRAPFRLAGGQEITVDRMKGRPNIGLGSFGGAVVGELPYGGQAWVMTIVLPGEDETLEELVGRLDGAAWDELTRNINTYRQWDVEMPRFELKTSATLNESLKALGMGVAFTDFADFSRLTPERANLDLVKQDAYLKVDEEGTEAAAVTTVVVETSSAGPDPNFIVDRPFLLAIRERLSGTILFLGAIGDPRGS